MLALLLAVALTAAPRYDTIITRDGARLAGTVTEESPTKGVSVQLPDGTLRRFDPGVVVRIEFADGSVSTWEAPKVDAPTAPVIAPTVLQQPAAAPPAAAAPQQAPPPADGALDTIFFVGGGRARGHVLEFIPKEGLTLQLPDGSVRRFPTSQIEKIQYADGTVSQRKSATAPPLPPPPPAYAGPPAYPAYPPPSAPPPFAVRRGMPPLLPVWLSFGVGGIGFAGDLAGGVPTDAILHGQLNLQLEGGIRLVPSLGLAVYLDTGFGDPSGAVHTECLGRGTDCSAETIRAGLLLRYTFDPFGRATPWIAFGGGWAETGVTFKPAGSGSTTDYLRYTGWEPFRFMLGADFRSNQVLGVGFYAGVSWAYFDHYRDVVVGSYPIADQRYHTMFEGGLRVTLFP
ncbi:MAG TPA: hypothetical protein VM753_20730 [Anaeromyxobacter sp.]|jgi:hypothetical protein|nr:hypothetical protein [Anaeromyxobacter sp.]